mmetsp:Transcript_7100/g.13499  ORF Transcript_7100/g.13499 Transcript_7100/m.13499 type:complete len:300 (+) Transcript_7100:362-1261(+)
MAGPRSSENWGVLEVGRRAAGAASGGCASGGCACGSAGGAAGRSGSCCGGGAAGGWGGGGCAGAPPPGWWGPASSGARGARGSAGPGTGTSASGAVGAASAAASSGSGRGWWSRCGARPTWRWRGSTRCWGPGGACPTGARFGPCSPSRAARMEVEEEEGSCPARCEASPCFERSGPGWWPASEGLAHSCCRPCQVGCIRRGLGIGSRTQSWGTILLLDRRRPGRPGRRRRCHRQRPADCYLDWGFSRMAAPSGALVAGHGAWAVGVDHERTAGGWRPSRPGYSPGPRSTQNPLDRRAA